MPLPSCTWMKVRSQHSSIVCAASQWHAPLRSSPEEMTSSPANRSIAQGLTAAGSTMQWDTERVSHRGAIERKRQKCKEACCDILSFSANTRYDVEMTSNAFWVLSGADDRRAGVCVYLTVISLCDLPAGVTRQIFLLMCVYVHPYWEDIWIFAQGLLTTLNVCMFSMQWLLTFSKHFIT